MKRTVALIAGILLLAALVPGGAVFAKQPNGHHEPFDVGGSFVDLSSVPVSMDPVSQPGKMIMNWVQKTEAHGTFEGTCDTEFVMTINLSDWTFRSVGTTVFTGRVDGLPGESTHTFDVNGRFTAPFTPGSQPQLTFGGPAQIVSGEGALSHLRGGYTLAVRINQPTAPAYQFDYHGEAWYEAHIND